MFVNDKSGLQQDTIGNLRHGDPSKIRGFVFGRAPVVNDAVVDLWEGPTTTYVFPNTAQQMKVVSTSAADTSDGTGCQKVFIHYLDANYISKVEQVTLSGVTPVSTVATDILRINAFHSAQVGTGGVPAGNISLTNGAGTVTYGFIKLGLNVGLQAIYTVPAGVTGYINHWQGSSGSTGNHFCQVFLRATSHEGVYLPNVLLIHDAIGTQNGGQNIIFLYRLQYLQKLMLS